MILNLRQTPPPLGWGVTVELDAIDATPVTGPALDYRLWSVAVLGSDAASLGEHHRTLTSKY